ncbi:MAG: hypothetical protein M1519_01075, partial [Actinobacteria bacterium]|nr:hypothetical protein [Actinomycetota bacterium]
MGRYTKPSTRSRRRPRNTPVHVARFRLDPTPSQARTILVRSRAETRIYNACLGEAKKRLERLRADPAFVRAKAMDSGPKRTAAFRELNDRFGFTESALISYASSLRKHDTRGHASWVRNLVGAQEAQAEGRNAFRTAKRWAVGLSGKPKFRSYHKHKVLSAECKDRSGDIKPILESGILTKVCWRKGFEIPVSKPQSLDEQGELERIFYLINTGALLYCRMVSRLVGNYWQHEAQFILGGPAPLRHTVGSEEMVTIDSGPSWLHVVSDTGSCHVEIAPSVDAITKELRRLQRHLDHQHRKGSPQCFDEKGRHIQGYCHWKN